MVEGDDWQQAMFCWHCLLMMSWTAIPMMGTTIISFGNRCHCCGRPTLERELGALLEETKTLGARSSTNEVGQGTSEETAVNVGAVTSVGGLVAAGQLSLVTALVFGLLDSHVAGDGEANVAVALVASTVGVAGAVVINGGWRTTGHGHDGGSESKNSSSDGELHCDGGFGIERELKLGVACKRALVWKDWTVRERKKANQRM